MISGFPIDVSEPVATFGFEGRETWVSHRGYIWSRSFPVLFKNIILGSGSDTFINEFPQGDVVGKLLFMNEPYVTVDKAHNLYIQTGIVTGGISMLALIALFGYYIFISFVSLIKPKDGQINNYGLRLGLFASVFAFSVSSMATDSTIGSTGVFYIILGMGYALNRIMKKEVDNP